MVPAGIYFGKTADLPAHGGRSDATTRRQQFVAYSQRFALCERRTAVTDTRAKRTAGGGAQAQNGKSGGRPARADDEVDSDHQASVGRAKSLDPRAFFNLFIT